MSPAPPEGQGQCGAQGRAGRALEGEGVHLVLRRWADGAAGGDGAGAAAAAAVVRPAGDGPPRQCSARERGGFSFPQQQQRRAAEADTVAAVGRRAGRGAPWPT